MNGFDWLAKHENGTHPGSRRTGYEIPPVRISVREKPLHQLNCSRKRAGDQKRPHHLQWPVQVEEQGERQNTPKWTNLSRCFGSARGVVGTGTRKTNSVMST